MKEWILGTACFAAVLLIVCTQTAMGKATTPPAAANSGLISLSQYHRLDLGLNWHTENGRELGVVGENRVQHRHSEFAAFGAREPVPGSLYGYLRYSD